MGRRIGRLLVAMGVLVMLPTAAPPARATTVLSAAFTGAAILSGPLGYPCIGPTPGPFGTTTVGTIDPLLCPHNKLIQVHPVNGDTNPTFLTVTLTLLTALPNGSHIFTTQTFIRTHHNLRTVLFLGTVLCLDVAVNVNKPGKALTHAGSCSSGLAFSPKGNTVAGNCNLATGQIAVTFTDALGQTYLLDLHLTGVPTFVIHGHWRKVTGGQQGLVVGLVDAIPSFPLSFGNGTSCFDKTDTIFQLVGVWSFVG